MAVAVTISVKEATGRSFRCYGTLTFSGSYATNGDTLAASAFLLPTTKALRGVDIRGKAGYQYSYDIPNGKVIIRQQRDPAAAGGADIPFTELAAGAYPGGVTGDVVTFEAVAPKFG